jgi:glycosyltransferase involved in cell wall biosynthesis
LKVLQITSNDAMSGGGIAIRRLHKALIESGHEAKVLTGINASRADSVMSIQHPWTWRLMDWGFRNTSEFFGIPNVFVPSAALLNAFINKHKPDVIHLHWLYGAAGSRPIPISLLPSLSRQCPVFWTFHDMWPITGGCTNALTCDLWKNGCHSCRQLKEPAERISISLQRETTGLLWKTKKRYFAKSEFTVICPSQWLTSLVNQSPLMEGKDIYHIPNGIDKTDFRPLDQQSCRQALGLPHDKLLVLFIGKASSVFAYHDRIPKFLAIMQSLKHRDEELSKKVCIVIVGKNGNVLAKSIEGYETFCLGSIENTETMVQVYCSADLLLYVSQYDNLPGVVQESLSCGTPVVASNVGGIPEMVIHLENGYLAPWNDIDSYVNGIRTVLRQDSVRKSLQQNASQKASAEYDMNSIVKRILNLYERQRSEYNRRTTSKTSRR